MPNSELTDHVVVPKLLVLSLVWKREAFPNLDGRSDWDTPFRPTYYVGIPALKRK